jgi:hypothetical protein
VPGIHDPAFLVEADGIAGFVPAGAKTRFARVQHVAVFRRSPKRKRSPLAFRQRAPEDGAHVEATGSRAIEHIEQGAVIVRHDEVRRDESDRNPDAMARRLDGRADAPEGAFTVDQRAHDVSGAHRIGTVRDERNMRRKACGRGKPGFIQCHCR